MNEPTNDTKEKSEELIAIFTPIFLRNIDQKIEAHYQDYEDLRSKLDC